MRRHILPILARYRRMLYVEPFGGAGGLLFGKNAERQEVYNDINGAFCSLFRVVKDRDRLPELQFLLDVSPMSRELWNEAAGIARAYLKGESISELKRAAGMDSYDDDTVVAHSIFYSMNLGFGGKVLSSYGGGKKADRADSTSASYWNKRKSLSDYCERLATVSIENLDALDCVLKYDHETTLFYLDPPYSCKTKDAYKQGEFNERELVDLLKTIQGKFVLSCYDTTVYNELNAICDRYEFETYSSVCKDGDSSDKFKRTEVVYASKVKDEKNLFGE